MSGSICQGGTNRIIEAPPLTQLRGSQPCTTVRQDAVAGLSEVKRTPPEQRGTFDVERAVNFGGAASRKSSPVAPSCHRAVLGVGSNWTTLVVHSLGVSCGPGRALSGGVGACPTSWGILQLPPTAAIALSNHALHKTSQPECHSQCILLAIWCTEKRHYFFELRRHLAQPTHHQP
jgi:hypothetical protein